MDLVSWFLGVVVWLLRVLRQWRVSWNLMMMVLQVWAFHDHFISCFGFNNCILHHIHDVELRNSHSVSRIGATGVSVFDE